MMNKYLLIFIIIVFNSCREKPEWKIYQEELMVDYPMSINSVNLYVQDGNYYIVFSGTITNNTEHFLDELYFYPSIEYIKTTGDFSSIKMDKFRVLKEGNILEKKSTLSFSQECKLHEFNTDILKYEFELVELEIGLKGGNSTGYHLGVDFTTDKQTWQSAVKHNILNEWKAILK